MASMNEINEQFEEFGIELSAEALAKCIDICITFNITDAAEFVEEWIAYSVSKLDGAAPTVEYLSDLERKVFFVRKEKQAVLKKTKTTPSRQYASPSVRRMESEPIYEDPNDDFMDSYVDPNTPKAAKKSLPRTPIAQKRNILPFTPSAQSPITGTPRSAGTEAPGKPVYTFGKAYLIEKATWSSCRQQKVNIKQILTYNNEPMTTKAKYLYDSSLDKSIILSDRLYHTATKICKNLFGTDTTDYELHNVDAVSQDQVKIIGRIACDFDGKLDPNSTIIVGVDEFKLRTNRLNFSKSKPFGVFPGQTIIASGSNPRGETFYVNEIFASRLVVPPSPPELAEPVTLVVAAGPFTNSEDLVYDPLQELILYCKDNKPDVLVLAGPFLDADHKIIVTNELTETFESFFEKMVAGIVDALGDLTICMVSSAKDAMSHMVYPTPPNSLKKIFPDVHMLPDPCIVNISGIKVGITSTDIVSHLLEEELTVNAGDKVKRVVNYMLNESSFYPLNPPVMDICYDSDLANKFARFDEPPNILLLPSKEKCFIRDINNCLVINPGSLSMISSRGTFARITVNSPPEGARLADYVASQVVRI